MALERLSDELRRIRARPAAGPVTSRRPPHLPPEPAQPPVAAEVISCSQREVPMRLAKELPTDLKLLTLLLLDVRTPEHSGDSAMPPERLVDRDQAVQLAEQRGDLLGGLTWSGITDLADLHERAEERRGRRPELAQVAEQDRHVPRVARLVKQQGLLQHVG